MCRRLIFDLETDADGLSDLPNIYSVSIRIWPTATHEWARVPSPNIEIQMVGNTNFIQKVWAEDNVRSFISGLSTPN